MHRSCSRMTGGSSIQNTSHCYSSCGEKYSSSGTVSGGTVCTVQLSETGSELEHGSHRNQAPFITSGRIKKKV